MPRLPPGFITPMWPVGKQYKGSIITVVAVSALGLLLQFIFGNCDLALLRAPVSVMLCAVFVLTAMGMAMFRDKKFVRWFSGAPFSVAVISAILICALVMGLVPQGGQEEVKAPSLMVRFGMISVSSSWPFVMLYVVMLLSLGTLVARRLAEFNIRHYAFYLNHIGLWLLLAAAGFGAADSRMFYLKAPLGETIAHAQDEMGNTHHLPFTIRLDDFDIEYYAPNLGIFDPAAGYFVPEKKPEYFHVDDNVNKGKLGEWNITVAERQTGVIRSEEGTPRSVGSKVAGEAFFVKAKNASTAAEVSGWLYRNDFQAPAPLPLGDGRWLMMTRPEPEKYVSRVTNTEVSGETHVAEIEVNKPLKIGAWTIYQSGYDMKAGRMSQYSIFQIVYDPWINLVYAGIIMLAAGAVCMIWSGKKRKGDDME